ncbi:MAG TPA: HD domain-containing protein [Ktedonobacterales bacterium]|nr:HD domain-containing protein [Ktedonobacterales bacterium]
MRAPARPDPPRRRARRASALAAPDLSRIARADDPASLHGLLQLCAKYLTHDDLKLVYRSYQVAAAAHEGTLRQAGEPYIEHPLAVAAILAELALDAQGIAAALLHDVVEDTSITREDVERDFGVAIAELVDGVTKFNVVEAQESTPGRGGISGPLTTQDGAAKRELKIRQQVETTRKLFGAMLHDPRVVLLKLADRLHNLRTMEVMPLSSRQIKARETLDIFAPLAGRIGLYLFKIELEDLAFKYLYPEEFARVARRLEEVERERAAWADAVCVTIQRELAANGVQAAVNWRMKRAWSAYRDARQSQLDISALHDVFAFRTLLNTTEDCYLAIGLIHRLWRPHADSVHDYIAVPKTNGYQSLHTTVFALDERLAQLHIRTHHMHVEAQHGVAAQWLERAARGQAGEIDPAQWLKRTASWVGLIANWHGELNLSATEFVETVRREMFADQVFVFTPKGDAREMPAGSTALDLAYRIHTNIGDTAISAWVQTSRGDEPVSMRVPLSYTLRTGDVVTILRDPTSQPRPEWLTIARTRYAQERIKRSLRRMPAGTASERVVNEEPSAETEPDQPELLRLPSGKRAIIHLARCCYPVVGDAIEGLAGRGRLVTAHRACCRTLRAAVKRRREEGQPNAMPVPLSWSQVPPLDYAICLTIYGLDYAGLMYDVSAAVADMGLDILQGAASANRGQSKAAISIIVGAGPERRADEIMRRLRALPGVTRVERDRRRGCDGSDV